MFRAINVEAQKKKKKKKEKEKKKKRNKKKQKKKTISAVSSISLSSGCFPISLTLPLLTSISLRLSSSFPSSLSHPATLSISFSLSTRIAAVFYRHHLSCLPSDSVKHELRRHRGLIYSVPQVK